MKALPFLALVAIGASWGGTQPLTRIAVSEGHGPLGLLVWQQALIACLLGGLTLLRGRRLPLDRGALGLYLVIALIGSVLPGTASYSAAVHLPSGVLSILLSSVPMLAFPVALALGMDAFRWRRLIGLGLGFGGVALLILPQDGLPPGVPGFWVGIALLASLFYAFEGNYVARWGTRGLDPLQVLTGASLVGVALTVPLALGLGQWIDPRPPWGAPERALMVSAVLHGAAYAGYVWLVGAAGSVFAVQASYLVTLFGVSWAMLFLDEAYSGWVWAALALMLAGMALVQPRPRALVPVGAVGQNAQG